MVSLLKSIFVFILLFTETASQTVTVPTCNQTLVEWEVAGGTVGGVTHVETASNPACQFGITSSTSQTFSTDFSTCGASPEVNANMTELTLIIIVQGNPYYNGDTDSSWSVTCQLNSTIHSAVRLANENPNNTVLTTINPRPQLSLYINENGTETLVGPTTVLAVGTNVTARITLDTNTSDYKLQITNGEIAVMSSSSVSLVTLQLLDGATYCAIYPVFMSFIYLQTVEGFMYAETTFEVFIPTITSIDLKSENSTLKIRFSFSVSLCLVVVGGCSQVTCPDRSSRRRRQLEDQSPANPNNEEHFELSDGFLLDLDGIMDKQKDNDSVHVNQGTLEAEDKICLEETEFFGLIGFFGFLELTCLAVCSLMLIYGRCRNRREITKTSEQLQQ